MPAKKVLIIDDDKDFVEECSDLLKHAGYDTATIDNDEVELNVINSIKPHVILLDLKMPGKSGFAIAAQLRGASETRNIPIIAMSGAYVLREHDFLTNYCGIKKFLKKPVSSEKLLEEVGSMAGDDEKQDIGS